MSSHPSPSTAAPSETCPVGVTDCPLAVKLQRQLYDLSLLVRTDPLTGVANYRYFCEALEQEIERSLRNGRPTSLLMIDIDHFKKVNDMHGHEVGNQALIQVARMLERCVRKLDIVCRYGGEEFAVILPETDPGAGIPVAERIRRTLAETPLKLTATELPLTLSLGLATYRPQSPITAAALVKQADHYLYQAKQQGRNQVCHAKESPPISVTSDEKQELLKLFGRGPNTKD